MIAGDGQVASPISWLPRPLVVQVTDETGTPVPDALVSFRLPEDGVSGLFRNGLKTDILTTDSEGKVALHSLRTGGLAGQFQVRLTVAKGAARAGAISTQFIRPEPPRRSFIGMRPGRRTIEIGALVLAVAAIGYVKQRGGSSTAKVEPPPTIGSPTITIGKPQ